MRIDSPFIFEQLRLSYIPEPLMRLNIGSTIRVQAHTISPQELLLSFPDGNTVKATTMAPMNIVSGEYINLELTSKKDNQLFLKPLQPKLDPQIQTTNTNIPQNSTSPIQEAVEQLVSKIEPFISKTLDVKEVARFLINNNVPINASSSSIEINANTTSSISNIELINRQLQTTQKLGVQLSELESNLAGLLVNENNLIDTLQNTDKIIKLVKKIDSLFIKPGETPVNEIDLNETYNQLIEVIDEVEKTVSNLTFSSKDSLVTNIGLIRENIQFLNIISNYNTYMQLPLNIWGQKTNGELYVMKNPSRKNGQLSLENMSVFLSLDMPHIGTVESMIGFTNKNISMVIKLENEEVQKLVKEKSTRLYSLLGQKGYKLVDLNIKLIDEKSSLLQIAEDEDLKRLLLKNNRVPFDKRI